MNLCTADQVQALLPSTKENIYASECISASISNASIYVSAYLARLVKFSVSADVPAIVSMACAWLACAYVINMQFSGGAENEQMELSAYYEKLAKTTLDEILAGKFELLDAEGEIIPSEPVDAHEARPLLVYGEECRRCDHVSGCSCRC